MEEKSRFAQILIFWDAVLLGTLIFISLSVKPGLRCLWLHSAMLAECAIGLLILGILTFGKSEPDIVHGRLFTVMIGGISLQLVLYYDQPLILHTFLLILMLTITIYRNFSLCKFAMVEMMVLYLVSVLYYWNVGFGDNVSVMYSVVAAGGVLGGSFILSCILGTEEKNRRIIRENRQTSIDMLRLVEMKKEEAEHLAEVKSVFLANMSHEIRTPMNAVLGMNEMILRESSEEEIVEYAKNIERAGETLMSLINDVLDISKIESGKIEIHSDEYKLETLVDDLMNLVSVKAEEKGLEIRQEFDQDIPGRLYGDELRIKQILINVLNNAIKYTDKGTITFGLSWEQTEPDSMLLKIRVTDTGIGMKEEELKHIFDAFQRLDEKRNQSVEGTGLGMTITKQLIELMGGKISVRSKYGKGTTFYLELPQEILDPAPAQFQRKRKKAEQQYRVSFVAPGVRILAVDDNPMNLAVLRGLLKKTEMQVDLVQSGLEAIAAVQKERYDMILMDHMMPKMDAALFSDAAELLVAPFSDMNIRKTDVKAFLSLDQAEWQQEEFYFFKITIPEAAYVLVLPQIATETVLVGRLAVCQIRNLLSLETQPMSREQFILEVLHGKLEPTEVLNTMQRLHIASSAWMVYVLRTVGKTETACMETLKNLFCDRRHDFLLPIDEETIVLVKDVKDRKEPSEIESIAYRILDNVQAEAMQQLHIGYGRLAEELIGISKSYEQALQALEIGSIFEMRHSVMAYERLGVGRLVYELPRESGERFLEEVFSGKEGELEEEDLGTIERFLENNLNISETARQMYIHRNTLVYRLERVQKMTGLDVRRFEDAMKLRLALMIRTDLKHRSLQGL